MGGVGVLLSLTLAPVLWLLSRSRPYRICYQRLHWPFIYGKLPTGVRVFYHDQPTERVSLATIIIWNNGGRAITADRIANPIKISFRKGDLILQHVILCKSDESNNAKLLKANDHSLILSFDNLDRNEGVAFDVLHNSQLGLPHINGKILEHHKKGFKDYGTIRARSVKRMNGTVASLCAAVLFVALGIVTFLYSPARSSGIVLIIMSGWFVGSALFYYSKEMGKCPKDLDPFTRIVE